MPKKIFFGFTIFISGLFIFASPVKAINLKTIFEKSYYKARQKIFTIKSPTKIYSSNYKIEGNYIKDEVIVKFKPEIAVASSKANSTIQSLKGAKIKRIDKSARFTVVKLPKNTSALEATKYYESLPEVEYTELNYLYKASFFPNDQYFPLQWNFNTINLNTAWDYDTTPPLYGGDPSIIVAVIDTGIAYENYDIYSKASDLVNTNFINGYNFVANNSHANDDNGHGTHVAGTIAQSTNNFIGVAGIAFNTKIMPIKVLNYAGIGTADAIASGITFAKENGAHILNLSLGSPQYSKTIADAVAEAISAGKILIAAAGNGGQDGIGDPQCDYPARYEGVICVGATRYDNQKAFYSNYGEGLDIVAPGGDMSIDQNGDGYPDGILQNTFLEGIAPSEGPYISNFKNFDYWFANGTSQATSHVSGVAALLMAAGVPASNIENTLIRSATDIGTKGYDSEFGWGLLNAANVFTYPTITSVLPSSGSNDFPTKITITGKNFSPSFLSGAIGSTPLINLSYINPTTVTATVPPYLAAGIYNISITFGNKTATLNNAFTVLDAAPPKPTNFSITPVDKKIILLWTKPNFWDFAGVKILRKTSGYPKNQNDGKLIYKGKTAVFKIDKTVKNGKKYYYSLFAYDKAGNYSDGVYASGIPNPLFLVTGPDHGKSIPSASYDKKGKKQRETFYPFGKGYKGGVNIAVGDLDGDGQQEIIFGTKNGQIPKIIIYDRKGKEKFKKKGFYPFGKSYKCGINIAAGDINNDNKDEIIAGLGYGCHSWIKIFNKNGKLISKNAIFKAYKGKNGVKIVVGDVNGDGIKEIITAPEKRTRAKIYFYNQMGEKVLNKNGFIPSSSKRGIEFFAGDVNFDGLDEIIVVPQKEKVTMVKIFNYHGEKVYKKSSFYPFGPRYKNEINITVGDLNSDGYKEILIAKKYNNEVFIYSYKKRKKTPKIISKIFIDPGSLFIIGKMK